MTLRQAQGERKFAQAKRVCCAVSRCMTVVEPDRMMCLTHWLLVPREMQVEIGHTYRARQMRNYQDAYRRAVDHVEGATGVFTGIFEKRASAPAREEGGGSPVTLPSTLRQAQDRPIGMRVRRPRLTVKRLAAIEEALLKLQAQHRDYGDALLWVRGERAKRRARKAVRA